MTRCYSWGMVYTHLVSVSLISFLDNSGKSPLTILIISDTSDRD